MLKTKITPNESLLHAVREADIPGIHLALEQGAHIDTLNNPGEQDNALMIAIIRKTTVCIDTLLEAGINVNFQKNNGNTALIYAATSGFPDVVEQLINAEAHINAKNNHGRTAFMLSAMNGHPDCLEKLINAGADIHDTDENGITALGLAARGKKHHIVKKLVAFGANIDVLDRADKKAYAEDIQAGKKILAEKTWQDSLQKQQNVRRFIRPKR